MLTLLHERRLDLSENIVLMVHPRGILLADRRPPHICGEAPFWSYQPEGSDAKVAAYAF
ncbi:MAG: hypothetical protein RLZZ303_2605, partial [Candidatus Hydrogenedentota bacterium]